MTKDQEQYYILAVKRAIRLLNLYSDSRPGLGISEIAQELSIHKSVVHKLLVTLESEDWVYQSPTDGKYYLGLRLLKLSNLVPNRFSFKNYAKRIMEELVAQVNETACLTVLDSSYRVGVCIELVESSQSVRHVVTIGKEFPLHSGASGLIMSAFMPPDKFEKLLASDLPCYTEKTITDSVQLREEVRKIKQQGYAVTQGQVDPGRLAIAAPILDAHGALVAGLNISGPFYRFQPEQKLQELIELVKKSAQRISEYTAFTI